MDSGLPQLHVPNWTYTLTHPRALVLSLVAAAGTIYALTNDDYLIALDGSTGEEKWTERANFGVPSVMDGVVYYGWNGTFTAFDSRSQHYRWQFTTGSDIESSAVFSNSSIYFGSNDGYLYALDQATGKLKWKVKAGDRVFSDPAISGDTVYFAGATRTGSGDVFEYPASIYALDSMTGLERWKFGTESVYAPLVANSLVFCMSGNYSPSGEGDVRSPDGYVYALDSLTGSVVWKYAPPGGPFLSSTLTAAAGVIYVADKMRTLHALEAATGQEKWSFQAEGNIHTPSIAHGVLYFGSTDGTIYTVEASTGHELSKLRTNGTVSVSPVIEGNTVYYADGHHIYAVR